MDTTSSRRSSLNMEVQNTVSSTIDGRQWKGSILVRSTILSVPAGVYVLALALGEVASACCRPQFVEPSSRGRPPDSVPRVVISSRAAFFVISLPSFLGVNCQ